MKKIKTYLVVTIILFSTNLILAQKIDDEDAREHFKYGNYLDAFDIYSQLVIKSPNNGEYNYRAGLCLLFTENDQSRAVEYLEKAVSLKIDDDAPYFLGKAYHSNLKLEKALSTFNT